MSIFKTVPVRFFRFFRSFSKDQPSTGTYMPSKVYPVSEEPFLPMFAFS
jgi:hypothetical protein